MENCPRCRAQRFRYRFKCRPRGTFIAVACELCGYEGPEVTLQDMNDNQAAELAAVAWNRLAQAKGAQTAPPRSTKPRGALH
jgi:hypothetical protein